MTAAPGPFGPWSPDLSETERVGRLRSLRTLVHVFCPDHPFAAALANAERNPEAAVEAWTALHTIPSLRRRMLSVFASVHKPVPS
jgi:hypothetical protein